MARRPATSAPPYVQTTIPATRAAVYVRVSTEDQAAQGYGLDIQRARCRAMAEAKGWTLVAEYADEGISGAKDATKRPGLADLLAAAHQRAVDAVVVLSLDRLGRKTRLVLDIVDALAAAGVDVVSCKESLDTTTPQGRFVLTMFAAISELERGVILQRTAAGRDERGRKDGERGGRVPLGYVRTPDGPQVDHDAAPLVRLIFSLRGEGLTLRAIAARLNADGVPCPRGGQRWEAASVRVILENADAYRGGPRADSPTQWPSILD